MQKSPVPVIENYDIVVDTYVAHFSTLDSEGNRIVQNEGGYKDSRGNAISLYFKTDPEDSVLLESW